MYTRKEIALSYQVSERTIARKMKVINIDAKYRLITEREFRRFTEEYGEPEEVIETKQQLKVAL